MSTFDMDAVKDPLALQPGTYRVEITGTEEKRSTNGNDMWIVKLKALDFGGKLCDDNFMLTGGGVNITKAKLSALGLEGKVEHSYLLGKMCWVSVKADTYKDRNGNERSKLVVDIDQGKCGYHKEKPGAVVEPVVGPGEEPPW